MKRIVLDTDVVIAGMRSRTGASAILLRLAARKHLTLLASVPLCLEYEAKCLLPTHRTAAGFSEPEAQAFVDTLISLAEPVHIRYQWRPSVRDPGDEMVLEAAVNGRADAIVSFNHKDYGNAPASFGIALLLPSDDLRSLAP
ncbi:MAG: putative toxin-antitoxin system toxin component, PIN family [Zoogloeaceae bacterium]|jgi:putative PIN family toxin of toxin-antitoxin system|nr:putative toxin-antitoxin system toxin component, PIN family [Zoogloeaceae bacterium]